jgi:enoyl-CoA hydratase
MARQLPVTGAIADGFDFVRLDVDDEIVIVTMNRPPVNAVNQQMYRELHRVFTGLDELAPGCKVAILRADGRHFCAGNDLAEFGTLGPTNVEARMAEVRSAFFAIQDCPVPVICAVQGSALGTGLALAASCDFVVAAQDARFGTPEVGVGVMGGARHLARLVPEPWVRWMYFSADPVPASELARFGGVVAVVAAADLDSEARRRAERVARHSVELLRTAKASLNAIETMDLQAGYRFEQSWTARVCAHPDSRESVLALLERRPPNYAAPH